VGAEGKFYQRQSILEVLEMKAAWEKFVRDERGTETVEWAIMIGLIAVASIAVIWAIGTWVQNEFTELNTGLGNPSGVVGT
jgi:Flp pilus assembly pilin Flp